MHRMARMVPYPADKLLTMRWEDADSAPPCLRVAPAHAAGRAALGPGSARHFPEMITRWRVNAGRQDRGAFFRARASLTFNAHGKIARVDLRSMTVSLTMIRRAWGVTA